jgi:hypothetical protein
VELIRINEMGIRVGVSHAPTPNSYRTGTPEASEDSEDSEGRLRVAIVV